MAGFLKAAFFSQKDQDQLDNHKNKCRQSVFLNFGETFQFQLFLTVLVLWVGLGKMMFWLTWFCHHSGGWNLS